MSSGSCTLFPLQHVSSETGHAGSLTFPCSSLDNVVITQTSVDVR